jgi:hypothetical protein
LGAIQFWSIATLMVVATTATLVVPMFWRMRENEAARTSPARRRAYALAVAAVVPLAALGCYAWWGRPDLAHTRPPADDNLDIATQHARSAVRGVGENGGDLGAATERLRTRLAQNPDDADGWLLLAQAYEFEGRSTEAADARLRAVRPSRPRQCPRLPRRRSMPNRRASWGRPKSIGVCGNLPRR